MLASFCKANNIPERFVETKTLDQLNNLKSVANVLRSPLWNRQTKARLLKLYRKAQRTQTERHWIAPAPMSPLIHAEDLFHRPLYLSHFVVSKDGGVQFQPKLKMVHTIVNTKYR